jgi:hypothetical protein
MTEFVAWYNELHRHAGIGLHTPSEVHPNRHHGVRVVREQAMAATRTAHPERFSTDQPNPVSLPVPKV